MDDELEIGIEEESLDAPDTPGDLGEALLEDQERVEGEVEPDGEESPEEDAEPEPTEDPTPVSTQEWARILSEQPQRWSEVPKRELPAVIQAIRQGDAQAAEWRVQQARQQAAQEAEYRARVQVEVDQLDMLRRDSPEQFTEWEESNPDAAAAYYRFKADRYQRQRPAPQVDPQQAQAEAYRSAGLQLWNGATPEVQAALQERAQQNPTRYTPTAAGLANLQTDINELMNRPSPRKAAAEQRKAVPKPDRTPGTTSRSKLRAKDLDTMTADQIAELPEEVLFAAMTNG